MAKQRRQKGMRKAYLKKWSAAYINTGSVDRMFPRGVKLGGTFIRFPHPISSRNIAAQNVDPIPPTQLHGKRGLTAARMEGENSIPLAEVIKKRWQSEFRMQGEDEFHSILIEKGKHTTLRMYFARSSFFFIEVRQMRNQKRRSIIYASRENALKAYKSERGIIWEEVAPINPSPPQESSEKPTSPPFPAS